MQVRFCPQAEAEDHRGDLFTALISITSPGSLADIDERRWHAVHRVQFHDIDLVKVTNPFMRAYILKTKKPFTLEQAAELRAFVEGMIYGGVRQFMIHCEAGISRSAAVAKWIADRHGGPALGPVTKYRNHHVYNLLYSSHGSSCNSRAQCLGLQTKRNSPWPTD